VSPKHYAEAGLLISEQLKEAPDHITVEMEFMYFLVFRELESIGMGDYVQAATYLEKQRTFLTRHMGLWIAEFSDLVHHHAHTSFYQKLAKVTKTLIQTEQSNIVEKSTVQLAKLNGGEKVSCLHDECTSDGEMINK
jgi:putative dimethyl sulfoxide reductase chaperone